MPLTRLCSQRPMFIFPGPTERTHSVEYVMGNLLVEKQFKLQRACVLLILKPKICSSTKYCSISIHRRSEVKQCTFGSIFCDPSPARASPLTFSNTLLHRKFCTGIAVLALASPVLLESPPLNLPQPLVFECNSSKNNIKKNEIS